MTEDDREARMKELAEQRRQQRLSGLLHELSVSHKKGNEEHCEEVRADIKAHGGKVPELLAKPAGKPEKRGTGKKAE